MPTGSSKRVISWACFDFANSAFGTLIGTFIYATFFTSTLASDPIEGTRLWGYGVAVSAIAIALLSPALGAVADAFSWKRRLMFACTALCSLCSVALYWPMPGETLLALSLFVVANTAIELAIVFNNGFLPELAPPARQGRVSGMAWGFGYVGGLLCLVIALYGFISVETPPFGLDKASYQHVRAIGPLVGVWVAVFSLPMLFWLHEKRKPAPRAGLLTVARCSFARLADTFRQLKSYRNVFWLLVARAFYNDGLVTVFAFGAIYATGTFGFGQDEVILFGIALNVCSGLGAFAFGFLDDRLGSRATVALSLGCLSLASLAAIFVQTQGGFWICAIVLGLFIGPNQSASRVFMSRILPAGKANEFFGFFALSGKVTAFVGPLLCGQLTAMYGSQRVGMAVVPTLLAIGLVLLLLKTREPRSAA